MTKRGFATRLLKENEQSSAGGEGAHEGPAVVAPPPLRRNGARVCASSVVGQGRLGEVEQHEGGVDALAVSFARSFEQREPRSTRSDRNDVCQLDAEPLGQ